MRHPETVAFSFILKIWVEESAEGSHERHWRGQITHVPSGRRTYVRDIAEIVAFVDGFLDEAGVRRRGRRGAWDWLQRILRPRGRRG